MSIVQPDQPPVALGELAAGDQEQLSAAEAGYAAAAWAPNTLRGYRADWAEFTTWCTQHGRSSLPADPAAITGYITQLATAGAKVGTISRRLSAIKFAHRMHDLPDPTLNARVVTVWEGIRRQIATPPDQSTPLHPPVLFDVLDACPTTWSTKRTTTVPETDLGGLRDRALLLVGFVAALRRSELADLNVDELADHELGLVASLRHSKTNQHGNLELVVLPFGTNPAHCPVTALRTWLSQAGVTEGPVFRGITRGNRVRPGRLHPESINTIVQRAVARAGLDPTGYSAHSLRAGFVTHAHLRGASDRAIMHQTRHRSPASVGTYVRVESAWVNNAATTLGI